MALIRQVVSEMFEIVDDDDGWTDARAWVSEKMFEIVDNDNIQRRTPGHGYTISSTMSLKLTNAAELLYTAAFENFSR